MYKFRMLGVLVLIIFAIVRLDVVQKVEAVEREEERIDVIKPSQQRNLRVLVLEGLFYEFWGIKKAVDLLGSEMESSSYIRSWYGSALTYFPKDETELANYNIVVMINVDVDSLADKSKYVEPYIAPGACIVLDVPKMDKILGPGMLKTFVERGGGLLIIGGHSAYGQGGYENTPLSDLLPVQVGEPFDVVKLDKPTLIKPVNKSTITDGILWKEKPVCFYIHDLKPKQDGQIILSCGEKAFLSVGYYGKGRVAAILGTVYGEEVQQGEIPFWKWSEWPKLMRNLIVWLQDEKAK